MIAATVMPMITSWAVFIFSIWILGRAQGVIGLSDMLIVLAFSIVVYVVSSSFCRGPAQFTRAVFERALYAIGVPTLVLARFMLTLISITVSLAKGCFFLVAPVILWLVYVVIPVDFFPEAIFGCAGYIDEILALPVFFWVSFNVAKWFTFRIVLPQYLRDVMKSIKPATVFP